MAVMNSNQNQTQTVQVRLNLSREKMLNWYRGRVHTVQAYDRKGRLIEFPIHILQPFMRETGIQGVYTIEFDHKGRFKRIVEC